jgi:hypothetical protein
MTVPNDKKAQEMLDGFYKSRIIFEIMKANSGRLLTMSEFYRQYEKLLKELQTRRPSSGQL